MIFGGTTLALQLVVLRRRRSGVVFALKNAERLQSDTLSGREGCSQVFKVRSLIYTHVKQRTEL